MVKDVIRIRTLLADGFTLTEAVCQESFATPDTLAAENFLASYSGSGSLTLDQITWSGQWSGHYFPHLCEILSQSTGTFEGIVEWDTGEHQGIRVKHGVVTHPQIREVLI